MWNLDYMRTVFLLDINKKIGSTYKTNEKRVYLMLTNLVLDTVK